MRALRALGTSLAAAVFVARFAAAQMPAGVTRHSVGRLTAPAQIVEADGPGAFVLEALGGSLGSLAGIAAVSLVSTCDGDNLECVILTLGAGGIGGAVGATLGTTLVARHTGSRRSVVGAALGAAVGTGVGLGLHYVFNRDSDRNLGDGIVVPLFVLSQGTLAALGSRLLGATTGVR